MHNSLKTISFNSAKKQKLEAQEEMQRIKYKIENWSEYNKALIERGKITLWVEEGLIESWINPDKNGRRGRSNTYSDKAIKFCLILKYLFRLPYRAAEGWINSLIELMRIDLKSPSYTQMQRRSKKLNVKLSRMPEPKGNLDIVVDSTGLKVYGEGEWKVRQHGVGKRRTWKKLHITMDPLDHEIVSWKLTENDKSDDQVFPDLLKNIEEDVITSFGDGAYDKKPCYDACHEKGTSLITPPRKDAILQKEKKIELSMVPRDRAIERIKSLEKKLGSIEEARKQWKIEADYHTRSVAETAMFRFKTICGENLSSRTAENQRTEVALKINILNQFTKLGMPKSFPEAA